MTTQSFTLFETAIGSCGVVWSEHGIVGVQLPEADAAKTRARLRRRFPAAQDAALPTEVQRAIDGMTALLAGEARDLADVTLDLERVPDFNRRVYAVARTIPPGATLSYGEIAVRLGDRLLAQDVGQAMGQNPFPIIVPCHRVLAAGGKIGGFSANGGIMTKRRMLAIESVHAREGLPLFNRG
jgi:methylated-DNA-[protein]-cysteine S-methyltransferase